MAKKPKLPDDCMPKCENCNAGVFPKDSVIGECHLLPMKWVPTGEGDATAMWAPASKEGWCRHFERKTH